MFLAADPHFARCGIARGIQWRYASMHFLAIAGFAAD
jgi:hypothetical protein